MTCTLRMTVGISNMSSRDLLQNPVRYGVFLGFAAIAAGFATIGVWLVIA